MSAAGRDHEHQDGMHATLRSGPMSRRAFLAGAVATAAACSDGDGDAAPAAPTTTTDAVTPEPPTATVPPATPTPDPTPPPAVPAADLISDPFTLGVASGDPTSDSAILWTRLAPVPNAGGGMPEEPVDVLWEVATDEGFEDVVSAGIASAVPALAHSLHVDPGGLEPDSWYWYRFRVGEFTSPTGRARTLPEPGASTPMSVAFASCQNFEAGFYAAHRHLAAEDADLFFWLGDYIYEYGPGQFPIESLRGDVRLHDGPQVTDLAGYRNRYALYKGDVDLQAHHAARPWVVTWDDHEVDNDYAGDISENNDPPDEFRERRAAAYQAWYEHLPVRLDPPNDSDYRIHRELSWGELAHFHVLDGRQHRADQPTDGEFIPIAGLDNEALPLRTLSATALDPDHSFLGSEQESWMIDSVSSSRATWKVLAQQVIMHGISVLPGQDPPVVVTDTWDGYYGNRKRILETLANNGVDNLVVLTGDFHAATVGDLKPDPFESDSPVVGTELMATGISSLFPPQALDLAPLLLAFNPQVKFFDARKGYTICRVTPEDWVADFRAVEDAQDPDAEIATIASFKISAGTPGAVTAT